MSYSICGWAPQLQSFNEKRRPRQLLLWLLPMVPSNWNVEVKQYRSEDSGYVIFNVLQTCFFCGNHFIHIKQSMTSIANKLSQLSSWTNKNHVYVGKIETLKLLIQENAYRQLQLLWQAYWLQRKTPRTLASDKDPNGSHKSSSQTETQKIILLPPILYYYTLQICSTQEFPCLQHYEMLS